MVIYYLTCVTASAHPHATDTVVFTALIFVPSGPITVWRCSPVFEGIGWGQIIVALYVTLFYSVLSAHSLLYLVLSGRKTLLWASCDNEWNDKETCYAPDQNMTGHDFYKVSTGQLYTS